MYRYTKKKPSAAIFDENVWNGISRSLSCRVAKMSLTRALIERPVVYSYT